MSLRNMWYINQHQFIIIKEIKSDVKGGVGGNWMGIINSFNRWKTQYNLYSAYETHNVDMYVFSLPGPFHIIIME